MTPVIGHWFKTQATSPGQCTNGSGSEAAVGLSALLSGQLCPGDGVCVGPVKSMDISP